MVKNILVKHQHLYTKEEEVLYKGEAIYNIYDDYEELLYRDSENARVRVLIYEDKLSIIRQGQIHSFLTFQQDETSDNEIQSPYGNFCVELFTHKYKKDKHMFEVIYDVVSSADKDGYHIIFEMKEEVDELN